MKYTKFFYNRCRQKFGRRIFFRRFFYRRLKIACIVCCRARTTLLFGGTLYMQVTVIVVLETGIVSSGDFDFYIIFYDFVVGGSRSVTRRIGFQFAVVQITVFHVVNFADYWRV